VPTSVNAILEETNDGMVTLKDLLGIFQESDESIFRGIREQTVWNFDVQIVVLENRVPFEEGLRSECISESNLKGLALSLFLKEKKMIKLNSLIMHATETFSSVI